MLFCKGHYSFLKQAEVRKIESSKQSVGAIIGKKSTWKLFWEIRQVKKNEVTVSMKITMIKQIKNWDFNI